MDQGDIFHKCDPEKIRNRGMKSPQQPVYYYRNDLLQSIFRLSGMLSLNKVEKWRFTRHT